MPRLRLVFLGLSITSSWGNGHATTYRGLVRALAARGHDVLFLERDKPWYAAHRDLPEPPYGRTALYDSLEDLAKRFGDDVRNADAVVVGSYVPEGVAVGDWVQKTARGIPCFYDIDTPVTLAALEAGSCEYLETRQIPGYRLYLSFTGGPTLTKLERTLRSPMARALYCSADPALYRPEPAARRWTLGYLGTYSADRQGPLDRLLLEPARRRPDERFVVAGPQYPQAIRWPSNVERIEHLAPAEHRAFYNMQGFTLNVTRANMVAAGWSPSVRLFEAAACAAPLLSDPWPGLEDVFDVGSEILITHDADETLRWLEELSEGDRRALGEKARARVLSAHTADHRAQELERYLSEIAGGC